MKHIKFLLLSALLTGLYFNNNTVNALDLSSKLNLQGADSVAAKANGSPSFESLPYADVMNNPMMNSMLGGVNNMLQNGNVSPYAINEMQKQQLEYAQQQAQSLKQMDKDD